MYSCSRGALHSMLRTVMLLLPPASLDALDELDLTTVLPLLLLLLPRRPL